MNAMLGGSFVSNWEPLKIAFSQVEPPQSQQSRGQLVNKSGLRVNGLAWGRGDTATGATTNNNTANTAKYCIGTQH
jgi:hypothetical protein